MDLMKRVITGFKRIGFSLCTVCLVDSTFLIDESKFFSGILMALSTMMSLELPHISVLSKCDLVSDKYNLSKYLNAEYRQKKVDFDDISHLKPENLKRIAEQEDKPPTRFDRRFEHLTDRIRTIVNSL